MNKTQLQKKVAYLEFVHDQLESEFGYLDELLKSVGFPRGVASIKEVAIDLLQEEQEENDSFGKGKRKF